MDSVFYNIYKKIVTKKLLSFSVFLLVLLSLLFVASKIEFEEDITKLIPSNDKTSEAQKVLKTVNFADKIIVNIAKESDGSVDDMTQYASQLMDSINITSSKYVKQIQGKIEDEDILETLDFVYKNLPIFLDESDYTTIQNKIQKDSIEAITHSNYKTLVSPSGFIAKESILKDPLGLSFIALKKLQQLGFGDDFIFHNGFLISKDKNHVLLFITPTFGSSETAENAKFAEHLYKISNQLNNTFKNKAQSEYFGGVLIAVANAKQIKQDIQFTVGIAMSILLVILIVFYKKISIPVILFVPTLFGGLLAVALLYLIRVKISAISLGIGSVLLGVTLDYSLHILTHIRSNNNVKALYKEITKPLLMSSLTTALAFLCLLFLNSQALQDLGIFAAISVIGASVFALLFIPLAYKDSVKKVKKNTFIDSLASFHFHKKKGLIITLLVAFVVSFFTYNTVTFNKDLTKLNYEPQHLKEAQMRLDALTNIASKSVYLAAYGNSEKDALEVNDNIYKKLQALKAEKQIIDFSSIGTLIHSEKKQKQRIAKWNAFWNDETITSTKNNLIESGNTFGFKSTTFHSFYTLLNTVFKPLQTEDYKALKTISKEDYITSKDHFITVTTLVKVQDENTQELIDIFKNNPQTLVIDRRQMNETFLGNLKNDFNNLVVYSLVVVLLLLLLFYRSFSLTLVTSIPIALTWLLTIGVMGLFHIEFNIFNIIISTFIFGLGIDYSIFITNGLLHEYKTGEKAFTTHKTSIILSVITTILGVGVLIFAKHPALYSISLVSIIGILSAVIISFSIQPSLFKLFIGSKTKRPITLRLLIHSILSFGYFGLGGILISLFSATLLKIIPVSKKVKMKWFHKTVSKYMKSVLYTNPFLKKNVINLSNETFEKPAIIIANHTSFLDILAVGMLHPKIIFLVNDWVYNSPVFGKAVQAAGFYPVSSGIENGVSHLQEKVNQGYSLMAFPEGTRSLTNKMKRFHKGAFYLAEQLNLDVIPVLIHGNSEVNPKGSFLIRNGSLTVKILERIPIENKSFGEGYKQRTKNISADFKQEFNDLRQEIEHDAYFHEIVLEDYRYKGDALYKTVKEDLKTYKETYSAILNTIDKKDTILHLSKDYGQLDFLLSLDAIDRKIISYIEDTAVKMILQNSFITNKHNRINFENTIDEALKNYANVLIINTNEISPEQINSVLNSHINLLILLKESRNLYSETINDLGFKSYYENENLIIFKR
ncbi:1-acyl-sn-glycerol-3-phosphate acyltransferase [Flavivirga rizhaonensis]|uniref:Glycerol acyltransferase n=1 Tax=Flavivirga rizhaonensis TaxID=2559571 RepID=A0A4S1DVU7_9FLAO|nr:1-acyl-sn-glycerol-3-phosphate acyltransferase [Flavivirga rizhaonensis]TGV02227.1 glycerol acyltransferase [Flavivirga rizhaonensis]